VRFNVKLESKKPLPAGSKSGQAQVIFIESLEKNGTCIPCISTTRVGIDGAWVGAIEGNSYFSVVIAPGEHNLCSDVQSKSGKFQLGMATLNAEAGKTYHYKFRLIWNYLDGASPYSEFELVPIGEDEANYRLNISSSSVFSIHP